MPVVINEFELSSAAAAKGGTEEASTGQPGPPALAPDVFREIEKALQRKYARIDRLTDY